jgi:threonine/homoserine/homoserine lactone efflux protein
VAETVRILFYGLVAAVSPTTVLAVLVVLLSRRGRANGIAFAAGFLLGCVGAFLTAFFLFSTIPNEHQSNVRLYAELALGVLCIAVAWRARRPQELTEARQGSRMEALFGRLEHTRPEISFSLGVALGVGTKRLVITAVAATSVAAAGLSDDEEVGLAVLYLVVGGLTVWLPVAIYLIAGKRADDWIVDAKAWVTTNAQKVIFYLTAIFGVVIVGDALVQLL